MLIPDPKPMPDYMANPSSERPDFIERIRAEARGVPYRPAKRKPAPPGPEEARYLFTVCTGNRWMDLGEREPKPKMLFGEFWHQGETSILFADTNAGKSVLATQIAVNIARGKKTGPFACGVRDQRVLYMDFELGTSQFYQRYSDRHGGHNFPENFFRAQINTGAEIPASFTSYNDFLMAGLEQKIILTKATVLIIDNISCLRGGTENAAVALGLMNRIKKLKADYNLSVLVLAHSPKRRSITRPICSDDLHGSKLLINFADSAFAIGRSAADKGLCYLKQIKQRNTEQLYGEENVSLCRIIKAGLTDKKRADFLQFRFEGFAPEQRHLPRGGSHGYNRATVDLEQLAANINELSAQGHSRRQVADELNIAIGTVQNMLQPRGESRRTVPPPKENNCAITADAAHAATPPAASDDRLTVRINKPDPGHRTWFGCLTMTPPRHSTAGVNSAGTTQAAGDIQPP